MKTATFIVTKSEITGQYVATITYTQKGRSWSNSTAHSYTPGGAAQFARNQIRAAKAKEVQA